MVLKNQILVGTVNASLEHFQGAVKALTEFTRRWPAQVRALITGRHPLEDAPRFLQGHPPGIKNVIALA